MGLVNGKQADLGAANHFDKGFVVQSLGSHIPRKQCQRIIERSTKEILQKRRTDREQALPGSRNANKRGEAYKSFSSSFLSLSQVSSQASRLCDESIAAAQTFRLLRAST